MINIHDDISTYGGDNWGLIFQGNRLVCTSFFMDSTGAYFFYNLSKKLS